jgi:hypothetical protein
MPQLVGALVFEAFDASALGTTAVAGTYTLQGIVGGAALLAEMTSATTLGIRPVAHLSKSTDRPERF